MRTITVLIVVLVAIALTGVGGLLVGGFWIGSQVGEAEDVTVSVVAPQSVAVGDTFEIIISVQNDLAQSRKIYDVDIWPPLNDHIEIVSVTPTPSGTDNMFGFFTAEMGLTLDPNDTIDIVIEAKAVQAGSTFGDVDVGVDSMLKIDTTVVSIDIAAN